MIYVRGQPEDFDHWGQLGKRGWSWNGVPPYFKWAEDWEDGADEFHGEGGPLLTSRSADKPALRRKIIEAGIEVTISAGLSRRAAAVGARAPREPICVLP